MAALPIVFFSVIFMRRSVFGSEYREYTVKKSALANSILFFGYLWIAVAVVLIMACMASTMMTSFFEGVSLLISPLNLTSWLVILVWILPGLLLRGLGRQLKRVER